MSAQREIIITSTKELIAFLRDNADENTIISVVPDISLNETVEGGISDGQCV